MTLHGDIMGPSSACSRASFISVTSAVVKLNSAVEYRYRPSTRYSSLRIFQMEGPNSCPSLEMTYFLMSSTEEETFVSHLLKSTRM